MAADGVETAASVLGEDGAEGADGEGLQVCLV